MSKVCDCDCHNPGAKILHCCACCEGQCRHCGKHIISGLCAHERACPDVQRLHGIQKTIDMVGGMAIKMTHVLGEAYTYIAKTPASPERNAVLEKIVNALTE